MCPLIRGNPNSAHVYNIFRDADTGKWGIQNYGGEVMTDADTVAELYDRYMPQATHIRLYSVDDDGEITQERKAMTARGLRDYRFERQLGTGNYNPLTSENGWQIGTNNVGVSGGSNTFRWNVSFNPRNMSLGANFHSVQTEGSTQRVEGFKIELQNYLNEAGFLDRNGRMAYEGQEVTIREESPAHSILTRQNWQFRLGAYQTQTPLYWQAGSGDGSTSVSDGANVYLGGMYMFDQAHLLGQGPLRAELGYGTGVNLNLHLNVTPEDAADVIEVPGGRSLNQMELYARSRAGINYQGQEGLSLRTGVEAGVNLDRIDGGGAAQALNILDLRAYAEVGYRPEDSPVGAYAQGDVDLLRTDQSVWSAGGGIELLPTDRFSLMGGVQIDSDEILYGQEDGSHTRVSGQGGINLRLFGLRDEDEPGIRLTASAGGNPYGAFGNIGLSGRF